MKISLLTTIGALVSVGLPTNNYSPQYIVTALAPPRPVHSRAAFLGAAATALVVAVPAWAADPDPALKGTKKDPAFEACLSKAMYDCTKPKGAEQKSRKECLPDCRKQCATTKEQMLKGTPVKGTTADGSSIGS